MFPTYFLRVKVHMVNLLNTFYLVFRAIWAIRFTRGATVLSRLTAVLIETVGISFTWILQEKKIMIMVISQSLCESFLVLLKREWEGGGRRLVTQWVERATPGDEVLGSIPYMCPLPWVDVSIM